LIVIAPLLPDVEEPDFRANAPLVPSDPLSTLKIVKDPLEVADPNPVDKETLPPVFVVDSPELKTMRPPAPKFPLPTSRLTLPATPDVAGPVSRVIAPLLPEDESPVLMESKPLTPDDPASAV